MLFTQSDTMLENDPSTIFLIKLNFSTLYCLFICSQKEFNKVRLLELTNFSDGGFKIESSFFLLSFLCSTSFLALESATPPLKQGSSVLVANEWI